MNSPEDCFRRITSDLEVRHDPSRREHANHGPRTFSARLLRSLDLHPDKGARIERGRELVRVEDLLTSIDDAVIAANVVTFLQHG